jgi:hypothetical protein
MSKQIQEVNITQSIVKLIFDFGDGKTNSVQAPVTEILAALEKHFKFQFEPACKTTFQ